MANLTWAGRRIGPADTADAARGRRLLDSRANNFDAIRLVAALAVVVSHSVAIAEGRVDHQPLYDLTRQLTLGQLGVAVFLIVSGYLVTASALRRPPSQFLASRALRIFPGLAVVVMLTAFVLGPLVTVTPATYWTDIHTIAYPLNILFVGIGQLPGVFVGNPMTATNGSLWTLGYEFAFYLVLLAIVPFLRRGLSIGVLGALLAASALFPHEQLFVLGFYFAGGMAVYLHRESIPRSRALVAGSIALLVITGWAGVGLSQAIATAGAYLVVTAAMTPSPLRHAARWGDFSYGTYLVAFPIQQAVTQALGGSSSWGVNVALSLPLILAAAVLLWHGVEKRALRLRHTEPVRAHPDVVVDNARVRVDDEAHAVRLRYPGAGGERRPEHAIR